MRCLRKGVRRPRSSSRDSGYTETGPPEEVFALVTNREQEPIRIPIEGVLDLHAFRPEDAASVVEEYISACLEEGMNEVRIIHGKGRGVLRRTVHAVLERHPAVVSYSLDPGPSGWGATVARLGS